MTLDEMIRDAEKRFNGAEEGSTEAIQAQAQLEALKDAKAAGYEKTQDDLNAAEKRWKEEYRTLKGRVEGVVGDFDQFENLVKTQVPATQTGGGTDSASTDTGQGESDLLTRFQSELGSRDEAIKEEREKRESFERELRQERLYASLNDKFKELGLQEKYAEAAREFVAPRMDSFVEKAMQNEDVTPELTQQAERLKELSGVWFESEPGPDEITIPGVPRSANGGERRELTDEERLKRAEASVI